MAGRTHDDQPPDIEGPEAEVEEQLVAPVDDESEMPIEEEPDLVGATEEESTSQRRMCLRRRSI